MSMAINFGGEEIYIEEVPSLMSPNPLITFLPRSCKIFHLLYHYYQKAYGG